MLFWGLPFGLINQIYWKKKLAALNCIGNLTILLFTPFVQQKLFWCQKISQIWTTLEHSHFNTELRIFNKKSFGFFQMQPLISTLYSDFHQHFDDNRNSSSNAICVCIRVQIVHNFNYIFVALIWWMCNTWIINIIPSSKYEKIVFICSITALLWSRRSVFDDFCIHVSSLLSVLSPIQNETVAFLYDILIVL